MAATAAFSGRYGYVKLGGVDYPAAKWNAVKTTANIDTTNFMSRKALVNSPNGGGDYPDTFARQQLVNSISKVDVEISGFTGGYFPALQAGNAVICTLYIVYDPAVPVNNVVLPDFIVYISDYTIDNTVEGALEWSITGTSSSSL